MRYLWLAVVCTCVLAGAAPGVVVISDAFDGHTTGAAQYLKGTATDVGGATWAGSNATGSFAFASATGSGPSDIVQSTSTNKPSWVPYAPGVGDVYAVSVDANLPASGKIELGFDATAAANAYSWLVYMEISQNGAWALRYRNNATPTPAQGQNAATGTFTGGLTTGTFYALALQWDPQSKTANAWIGGTQVVTDKIIANVNTSAIAYAGFGNNGSNTLKVDNFAVSVVPEPVTLVILLAGVGVAVLRRR
jgi:hypothetical protein